MGRYGHMGMMRIPKRGRPRGGRRRARPRRHERVPQAPDRRTLRRPEEARLPRPRPRAGRPRHPARRALHRRRRQDRGCRSSRCCANCATRAASCWSRPTISARVPEFCDRTILIKGTVLAYGPTVETFTQENLEKAFGGVLRHFVLERGATSGKPRRSTSSPTTSGRWSCRTAGQRRVPEQRHEERELMSLLLEPFTYGYMLNAMWVSRPRRRRLRLPLRLSDAQGLVADRRRALARDRSRRRRRLHARPALLARRLLLGRARRRARCSSSTSAPS